jgi:hypothetical protein
MSQADEKFMSAIYQSDMVALAHEDKELLFRFVERYFSRLFDTKARIAYIIHLSSTAKSDTF